MNDCIFCKVISRNVFGYIIDEDDTVICFLSLENHPLVVPKLHIPNIYSLDSENGNRLMSEMIKIANAVKTGLACDGVYITQANEPAAGQDVFHIHFHIYPRWNNREVTEKAIPEQELVEKIKTALLLP